MKMPLRNAIKALSINPNYVEALINKGYALGKLGKIEDEIMEYDKVLSIEPNNADAINYRKYAKSKIK